jgi:hypothetical protein
VLPGNADQCTTQEGKRHPGLRLYLAMDLFDMDLETYLKKYVHVHQPGDNTARRVAMEPLLRALLEVSLAWLVAYTMRLWTAELSPTTCTGPAEASGLQHVWCKHQPVHPRGPAGGPAG